MFTSLMMIIFDNASTPSVLRSHPHGTDVAGMHHINLTVYNAFLAMQLLSKI